MTATTKSYTDVAHFAAAHRITANVQAAMSNPYAPEWTDADHWKVTLRRETPQGLRTMVTYFSQGYGHNGKAPKLTAVLETLILDSNVLTMRDFADWCDEYGYNADSLKDRKTYDATRKLAERFRRWLGPLFDELSGIENV